MRNVGWHFGRWLTEYYQNSKLLRHWRTDNPIIQRSIIGQDLSVGYFESSVRSPSV